jgi:hypothetical protein
MIEPYMTHVRRAIEALPGRAFTVRRNDEYVLEASNTVMTIQFAIENPIEPAILIGFLDGNGKVFDLSLLEELIDPKCLDKKRRLLKKILEVDEQQRRSQKTKDEYARICADDLIEFVCTNASVFVDFPNQVRDGYDRLEEQFLKNFLFYRQE